MVDLHEAAVEASAELVRQRGGDACVVQADVTKSGDVQNYVKATLDAYGAIDCLFNNAGIEGKVMPMQDYDEADFDAVIAVNLKGVFLGMRHVLPVMLETEAWRHCQHLIDSRIVRRARHSPLCRIQACGAGVDQGCVRRCRSSAGKGECRLSRPGRDANDALAGSADKSGASGGGT